MTSSLRIPWIHRGWTPAPSHGQLGVPAECRPERGSKPRSGRLALPARTSSEEHRAPRGQRVTRRPGELVTEGDQTSCFDRWGQSEAGDRRAPSEVFTAGLLFTHPGLRR